MHILTMLCLYFWAASSTNKKSMTATILSVHHKNFLSIITAYFLCFICSILQVAVINVVAITLLDSIIFKVAPFQNVSCRDDILNRVFVAWMELSVLLSKGNGRVFETNPSEHRKTSCLYS